MPRPHAALPALAPRRGFRYLGRVLSVARVVIGLALFAAGCSERAKTAAEAYSRFATAVMSRDAVRLYAALDLETRWSWMTVRRAHREAYDILLSNLPEGAERDRQLRRFEAGALAENEGALFAKSFPEERWNERWNELGKDLPGEASPEPDGERAARVAIGGRTLPFRQGEDGGWGFAGLAAEAEEAKRRATADLELVRTNAADLERAATRAGR